MPVPMVTANPPQQLSFKKVAIANGVISTLAVAFLVWLVYFHESAQAGQESSILLPAINAALNSTAAALLAAGLFAIKQGNRALHKRLMLAALAASTGFLINYIIYHYTQGDTKFAGLGAVRPVYFALLISHILLSVVALPMILWTLFLALTERFALHKAWAKWTWALWMYVSVTGVIVFVMLHVIRWA
jgi:putative membrane protein